ncbi:hypothetical protein MSAN_02120700 [Mycena sanguinolenta]|uniref:Uncharacterized protein n=1 Tax=Mycena sanguinolenta TaxID=230812 RepID=A0A8H6XG24_9AGAR|nr:hypothetical protein MSAN_02120700 [Mycena sanguinolenta]
MSHTIHAGTEGIRGSDDPKRWGRGGKGGIGQGLNFGEPLVSIRKGKKKAVRGLNENIGAFCYRYYHGGEIANLLQTHHFNSPASLLHVTDVKLLEVGFRIGHVAELKRALRTMAGKELDEGGGYRPELYGGIGGRGGHGGLVGGDGGVGEVPQVPPTLEALFSKIAGGVGGEGGTGGRQDSRPRHGLDEATLQARIQRMLPFLPNTDARSTWIIGGIGGMGGNGAYEGGEGGVGEASHIPTGRVSSVTKIFGGVGGEGGTGGSIGGAGGTGRGTAFDELLGHADERTLTIRPAPLSDLPIDVGLRKRLRQQGFMTVGALFMVTGGDLLKVDGFELGDIGTLKDALEDFLLD